MTLQTCDYHPKPELVYGNIEYNTSKPNGTFGKIIEGTKQQLIVYITHFEMCVCDRTNYMYSKGEMYYSKSSRQINIDTLEVSINGGEYEKYVIKL